MLWARCRGRAWWLLDWRKLRQCFLFIIEKVNLVIVYVAWGIHLNILKIWWWFWERDYTCACVYRMHLQLPEYWRGMDNDLSLLLTAQLKSFCLTSICPPVAPVLRWYSLAHWPPGAQKVIAQSPPLLSCLNLKVIFLYWCLCLMLHILDARLLCSIWAFALTGVEVREGIEPKKRRVTGTDS